MDIIEFTWEDNLTCVQFETCPIRITATQANSQDCKFDEIRVYDQEVWNQICTYKGCVKPFAQLSCKIDGRNVVKTAIKSVFTEQAANPSKSKVGVNKYTCLNSSILTSNNRPFLTFGFDDRQCRIQDSSIYLLKQIPLASQIRLKIVKTFKNFFYILSIF